MSRLLLMVVCGAIALIVLYPMVVASLEGDGAAILMTILVVVATVGNWIAARVITKRRADEAARDATRELLPPRQ